MASKRKGDPRSRDKDIIEQLRKLMTPRKRELLLRHKSPNHSTSDVTFVLRGGDSQKEFRAHRDILATESDVFRTMFYGSLPEEETPIEIPDLHPDGFDVMLRYVYEDPVQLSSVDNAVRTLAVASKYVMDGLKRICCDYLVLNVTPDVACCVYEAACLYDLDKLKRFAFPYFILNTETIISDDSFLSAQQSTVQTILHQDTLSVPERQLFDAVLRWGKANAIKERDPDGDKTIGDIRAVIDPLLPYIRFLSMSAEEFTEGPSQSGVLTDEESVALEVNINCPGSRPLPPWVSRNILRNSAMDISVYPLCTLQHHDSGRRQWVIKGHITVIGTHLFWGVELILKKFHTNEQRAAVVAPQYLSQDSVEADVSFFISAPDYIVSENGTYTIERNGKCRLQLKNPAVFHDGETVCIYIMLEFDVVVLCCNSPEAVRDTPDVLFRTDCLNIHAVLHTVLECGSH